MAWQAQVTLKELGRVLQQYNAKLRQLPQSAKKLTKQECLDMASKGCKLISAAYQAQFPHATAPHHMLGFFQVLPYPKIEDAFMIVNTGSQGKVATNAWERGFTLRSGTSFGGTQIYGYHATLLAGMIKADRLAQSIAAAAGL